MTQRYFVRKGTISVRRKGERVDLTRGQVLAPGDLDDRDLARCLKIGVVAQADHGIEFHEEGTLVAERTGTPSVKASRAAEKAAAQEAAAREASKEARLEGHVDDEDETVSPAKPVKWDLDPEGLEAIDLPGLNIMIRERDRSFSEPYETREEAIAHLTQDRKE